MSGQWPPERDDPEDIPGEADQQDTEAEAGLSAVAAYLASVPAPVMPGSVEARISAALAVEAAARAGVTAPASGDAREGGTAQSPGPVQPDGAAGARVLGPAPARARVRRRDRQERRRERDVRKIFEPRRERDVRRVLGRFVVGPLAVCLLIVIVALGLSRAGSSSSSSSAASGGAVGAAAPAGAASSAPAASSAFGNSRAASGAVAPGPASSVAASASASAADFAVVQTGTSYQRATLAQQARAQVLAVQARESGPTAVPSASSSGAPPSASSFALASSPPTAQVRACVLKVTGGVLPELVDKAAYQGTPAYVIASSSRVWVVGLGCTAARPQVIVSVPAAG
jgi:hypothetical protein